MGLTDILYRYFVFILLPLCILFGIKRNGGCPAGLFKSDQEGYYIYFPAILIHGTFKDVPFNSGCTIPDQQNGLVHTKYTYGVALLEAPFFLIGHAIAAATDNTTDGRSPPYAWAVFAGAIFYFLSGLELIKRFLANWFGKLEIVIALLTISLGTNLLYYSVGEVGMSHVYSFFLFSASLFLLKKWVREPKPLYTFLLSVVYGLIILIRPTNLILLFTIPLLGVFSLEDLRNRVAQIIRSGLVILIPVCIAMFYYPQFRYWEMFTGHFFSYSYGDEGFMYWNSPKIMQVLFSYRNGLFAYSPLLLLSGFGMVSLFKQRRDLAILTSVLFVVSTYIFASWWAWWFGGAFGHRAYVEYLTILIIPMTAFFQSFFRMDLKWKWILILIVFLLILANLKMTLMYDPPWDGPDWTWDSYLNIWKRMIGIT